MIRRDCIRFSTITALGLALLQGIAFAQQGSIKEQIVGTWKVVMCEVVAPDGTKSPLVEGNNLFSQATATFPFRSPLSFRTSRLTTLRKRRRRKIGPWCADQ